MALTNKTYNGLLVLLNPNHGTAQPEALATWLDISSAQHAALGGISRDTLAQWCRATTGQAGVLRLEWQISGQECFVFDIVPCGFSLLQTVIPSVEYESTGDSDGSATTDGDSSLYATLTADRDDCPDNLVSSFVDGSKSTWRCLANRSHTTLRKRLRMRDGRQCIFTGDRERVEVAHLMKPMHPFWNLVHITCTRAHLSQLPASLLQKVTGLFDPCVAASVCHGLLGYYADPGSIAFRVLEQNLERSSITLEVSPLTGNGINVRDMYRFLQGRLLPGTATTEQLYSVPVTSNFALCEPPRAGPATPGQPEQASDHIEINARPFDIYVEFGLGARIMRLYGSNTAKEISRKSPLNRHYEAHVHAKANRRNADEIARARAATRPT